MLSSTNTGYMRQHYLKSLTLFPAHSLHTQCSGIFVCTGTFRLLSAMDELDLFPDGTYSAQPEVEHGRHAIDERTLVEQFLAVCQVC